MRNARRFVVPVAMCLAIAFTVSTSNAGKKSVPLPPPPVLCGCACPDGSFVVTHAPDAASCPAVCEQACNNTM